MVDACIVACIYGVKQLHEATFDAVVLASERAPVDDGGEQVAAVIVVHYHVHVVCVLNDLV